MTMSVRWILRTVRAVRKGPTALLSEELRMVVLLVSMAVCTEAHVSSVDLSVNMSTLICNECPGKTYRSCGYLLLLVYGICHSIRTGEV